MALYIQLSRDKHQNNHKQAHVPFTDLASIPAGDVEQITADGHELRAIFDRYSSKDGAHPRDRVTTIPFPFPLTDHTVATWFGDMAKFIIANLA